MSIRQVPGRFEIESGSQYVPPDTSWKNKYVQQRKQLAEEIATAKDKMEELKNIRLQEQDALLGKAVEFRQQVKLLKKEMKRLKRAHRKEAYEQRREAYEQRVTQYKDTKKKAAIMAYELTPREIELAILIYDKKATSSQLARNEEELAPKHQGRTIRTECYRFYSGKYSTRDALSSKQYQNLLQEQENDPVVVMNDINNAAQWYMFKGKFYRENEGLTLIEVKALLVSREAKRKKKIEKAMAYLEVDNRGTSNVNQRKPIPDKVKLFVWKRDGGRCVKCGSRENLEFDHIIPVSKGGSNTARNIQLLCEKCNRKKGAALI